MSKLLLLCTFCALSVNPFAQKNIAAKPLFDDPVFHGAADPVIIYNKAKKKWWMLYTNRLASVEDTIVQWLHATRIGIAESSDGFKWKYVDTANINYRPDPAYTHWAPDVIEHNGTYHMYLTYVPGIFKDWNHPRVIIHLTSIDLKDWKYQSTLNLLNEKVIDVSVYKVNDSLWRMWYNRWDKILATLKKDDYVIMQFGHNDASPLDDTARARGTIKGIGNDSTKFITLSEK